jgi:hypothetical protein
MAQQTTPSERPATREPGCFYIDELSLIVNRKPDTIRKWERLGMLPSHLHPRRGLRDWRYWTDKQVYGKRGILQWMKDNDIRPGAYLTTPDNEPKHIANMRRPRGMKVSMLEEIRYWARTFKSGARKGEHRRSRKWIIDHYFEQTSYTSKENFERAITNYFAAKGWEFPPAVRERRPSARMSRKQVEQHPEVKRLAKEADKIIRFVDKSMTTRSK